MTDTANRVISRPQPLGVFPLPAGYLLIPAGAEYDDARSALVQGQLPEAFPDGLAFYAAALDGDVDRALELLGDSIVEQANALVLDPSMARYDALKAAAGDDAELVSYLDTVAFITGLRPEPPSADDVTGELEAMVRAAWATLALERRDTEGAIEELELGARAAQTISAPLAGLLMGQLANVQLDQGGTQRAAVSFQAALDSLEGTDLAISRAELHVAAGAMFQEMSEAAPRLMQQAINHYHQATALVDAKTAPELFAVANANLGLAYITMPMTEASDQLRIGVAVQSMREALKVFTPEEHLERWSSTQLNLANALVYMPSTHQEQNIVEAVELYEDLLGHRDRASDPLGRARVLANQGNSLAHLGMFADAKARLHEARAIFEEFEEIEAVRTVRSVLDEIATQESLQRQDRV